MEKTEQIRDFTEYVKLTRNSRGYSWDIKINDLDVERLDKKNEELVIKYGDKEE